MCYLCVYGIHYDNTRGWQMTRNDWTRRNIYLPDELWQQVLDAADAEEKLTGEPTGASQIVRQAIRSFIQSKKG